MIDHCASSFSNPLFLLFTLTVDCMIRNILNKKLISHRNDHYKDSFTKKKYIFPLYINAHIVTGFVGKQLIQNEIIKLKPHSV